jgi:hypothetical protein
MFSYYLIFQIDKRIEYPDGLFWEDRGWDREFPRFLPDFPHMAEFEEKNADIPG